MVLESVAFSFRCRADLANVFPNATYLIFKHRKSTEVIGLNIIVWLYPIQVMKCECLVTSCHIDYWIYQI